MTQIEMLEQHIAKLDADSFSKFREWFLEFGQARWDKKLEVDSNGGYFSSLVTLQKMRQSLVCPSRF